jgi:hypothetical protein
MAVEEPAVEEPDASEDEDDSEDEEGSGLLWVPKALIEEITEALEKKTGVSKEKVTQLIEADDPPDDAVMVPCDMADAEDIEDVENIVDAMGAEKVAELFVKGRNKFLDALKSMPDAARDNVKQEMTGAEYKKMMEDETAACLQAMEEAESEEEEDGEEEEGEDEVAPEPDPEPPTKKAKTD